MKIIFFGTSDFAVKVLKRISKSSSILAVVTQPNRQKGRHLKVLAPPVKIEAEKYGISVLQPADVNDPAFTAKLKDMEADVFLVVSYGSMLGKALLVMPKFGALNIHPSLLPKYRGAAPIQRALLRGEKSTGVTIIRMNERLDAGDIILQKESDIKDTDNGDSLSDKLTVMGADLFMEALRLLEAGRAEFRKQDEKEATFAPKLKKEDGLINWNSTTGEILRIIKALTPWPGTYSNLEGRTLKIIEAEPRKGGDFGNASPGEVVLADQEKGFIVKTKDGALSILELQIEGKKVMPAELFLRGHSVKPGARLG
ncbi:MAG: methionyl-tRNA formyltransferase [Candidatus Omnitrophica bacterium]|nr:methionyl-tRNA formyltransferase [Candidatus Omnitrophota bacterium]MBU4488579.1 methionyl-tRNA formyltransferase [Candidatus Omnitrophota bacterium]MCG2704459.1 methionyl-tRNA formyltransferase [Candidatus Omnitrophota bacterium]